MGSCKLCPPPPSFRRWTSLHIHSVRLLCAVYTLDPPFPMRSSFSTGTTLSLRRPRLLSPGGKLPWQVSPRVPNVCGTIREKFQVRHGRVRAPLRWVSLTTLSRSFARRAERTSYRQLSPPYKRRTRVILIRTRPRGVEVKAGFLSGVFARDALGARALMREQMLAKKMNRRRKADGGEESSPNVDVEASSTRL